MTCFCQQCKQINKEASEKFVHEMTCVVCKKNKIKPLKGHQVPALDQDKGMWEGGTVQKVTFGYGSSLDMDSYYMAICDSCASSLKKEGLAVDRKTQNREIRKFQKEKSQQNS